MIAWWWWPLLVVLWWLCGNGGSVTALWQLCGDPTVAVAALLWQWWLCGCEGGPVMVVPLWQLSDDNGGSEVA